MSQPATQVIDRFTGPHHLLSNFHTHPLTWNGITYPSAEHAFNAAKTLDPNEAATVTNAPTPAAAKRAGRRVTLRSEWDNHLRYQTMRDITHAKYQDPDLHHRLLATGDALLIEGNTHHDQTWGDCRCSTHAPWPGHNHLGRTLMAERSHLRNDPPNRWVRVAVTGHRPDAYRREQREWAIDELTRLATKVRTEHDCHVAISGFALGADTWWAEAALGAGLDLWGYIPFETQPDQWTGKQRFTWTKLRRRAARTVVLNDTYDVRLLHARNDLMIRDADAIIAVFDPHRTSGGTISAIRKAAAACKPVIKANIADYTTTLHTPQRP